MRYLYLCCFVLPALAQQAANTESRIPDLNGGYTTSGPTYHSTRTATGNSSRIEYAPSINGQLAPRESVEEKVIRNEAGVRVVERYVRRYDATGNPGPVEKSVIEERKVDGAVLTTTSVFRGDLNGNLAPAERTVSRAVTKGTVTTTDTTIERSNLDGALSAAERVQAVVTKTAADREEATLTRSRKDASGNFYEAVREVTERVTLPGNVVTENRVQYVGGTLAEQTVARTVKDAAGSSTITIDVFMPQQPGMSAESSGRLALREQQQVTTQVENGKSTQTVVTRKPSVSDANRLGPPQVLSQSTCTGTGCK